MAFAHHDPSLASIILRTRKKLFHRLHGEHESIFGGSGMEFKEVREYSGGDDIRHLNWKITARTGTPMVNHYNETKQLPVVLVYLNSGDLHFGEHRSKREHAIEVLSALGYVTLSHHDTLTTLLYSSAQQQWLAPGRHKGMVDLLFSATCALDPLGQQIDFTDLGRQLMQKIKQKSLIFLIGDFWEFGENHDLGELAFAHEIYCIIIRDHAEEVLPPRGTYEVTDPRTQKVHTLTIDKQGASRYRALIQDHEAMLQTHFSTHHIPVTKIYTDEDAIEKLAHFVRQ
jgi:uncharacterized protein (DUF58 family)